MGDFNVNILDNTDRKVSVYLDLLSSYGYYPCIHKPTRVQKHTATIIDQIWCNNINILSSAGIFLTDVSDHFAHYILLKDRTPDPKDLTFSYRDYKNINKVSLCSTMQEEIGKLNLRDDPNISFNAVSDVITQVVNPYNTG